MNTPENPAEVAYDAYCKSVGGKAFNGDTLPAFGQTPERIQAAWVAATRAAIESVCSLGCSDNGRP